tara:strand:- start:669 stop:1169 length:501 start_codon:yes stop_codon:yes gene_type:complete
MSCYLVHHKDFADLANYLVSSSHVTYTDGFDEIVCLAGKRFFVNSSEYESEHKNPHGRLFSWNLAVELAVENIRSCETRYPHNGTGGGFLTGSIDDWITMLEKATKEREGKKTTYSPQDLKHLAEMVDSIEYQSCENSDYYSTPAYKVLEQARRILLKDALEALDS